MKPIDFNKEFPFELVLMNNTPYMFTNMRIDRNTIPKGYVAYDIRESDGGAGDFASAEDFVMVNHWGTIVGKDTLPMEEFFGRQYYVCDEAKDDGCFIDDMVDNIEEFERHLSVYK